MYFGNSGSYMLDYDGVTWRKIFINSTVVRSLALDDSGKIWLGGNANFGYLEPDATGALQFVSILDKIPPEDRDFTDVWQFVLMSDGVVEARNAAGELLAFDRVAPLTLQPAQKIADIAKSFGQEDDITVFTRTRQAIREASAALYTAPELAPA